MENLQLKDLITKNLKYMRWTKYCTTIRDDRVNFKADQQKSSNLNNKEIKRLAKQTTIKKNPTNIPLPQIEPTKKNIFEEIKKPRWWHR